MVVKDISGLIKAHLSAYIALSAVAGHALACGRFDGNSLRLGGWVFLLAAGASVLNNIQDRTFDKKRIRTRNRVLARGALPLAWAWAVAAGLTGAAFAGLFFFYPGQSAPVLLAAFSLICYNGLYTPIKKISLWAMVPGTLCGMIPPVLGWAAVPSHTASSDISGLVILTVCLGVWQLPHYLLVELKPPKASLPMALSESDEMNTAESGTEARLYPKRYQACFQKKHGSRFGSKRAGASIYDSPGGTVSFKQLWPERDFYCQILIWATLFCIGMLLFIINGWVVDIRLFVLLFSMALFLPPFLLFLGGYPGVKKIRLGFWAMNLSMFCFLCIILLDRV